MNGAVLAARSASRSHSGHSCWRGAYNWSCLLPQEPFSRAYPLIPGRNCPTASHYLHLPPCRGGVRFMGHCRIESITLLPWGVWPSNPKWCHLLWDFMFFPTVHSLFVHLPFQHQQATKGNLQPHEPALLFHRGRNVRWLRAAKLEGEVDTEDTAILLWMKMKWPDLQGEPWLSRLAASPAPSGTCCFGTPKS